MASIKEAMTAIADAIRAKTGKTDKMTAAQMADEIAAMKIGGDESAIIDRSISGDYANSAIEKVGVSAFDGCAYLKSVTLPNCVQIDGSAFYGCTRLQAASIPNCKRIYTYSFASSGLKNISLPLCTTVDDYAFNNCRALASASLPACTTVRSKAFEGCSSLTFADLPACTTVGDYAFQFAKKLNSISLPACESIGTFSFSNTGLTALELPNCSSIEAYAISNDSSLAWLTVGTNLTTVCILKNVNALKNLERLAAIYVPDNLVSAYQSATNWSFYSELIKGISEKPAA